MGEDFGYPISVSVKNYQILKSSVVKIRGQNSNRNTVKQPAENGKKKKKKYPG